MASFVKAMLGLNKPKKGTPMLAPPVLDNGAESAMRRRALLAKARATAGSLTPSNTRSGTLLTGASGLNTPAPTARKSLLGD